MGKLSLLIGLLVAGCGAGADPGGSSHPLSCSASDRTGTYLDHEVTLSGDCGDVTDSIARIDNAAPTLPAGCVFDAPDRWSDSDCKLERAFTCDATGLGSGFKVSYVAVTTQDTDDGSRLSGTVTARIAKPDGTYLCAGTYSITDTRQ